MNSECVRRVSMGKLTLVVLLLLATCFQPTCSFMGSMLGGSITWRLHPEFESNRVVYFLVRTAFDKTDGFDEGTGIALELYRPPTGPGLNHGDRFGTLVVEATTAAGDTVREYPNEFMILEIDGDVFHGEMEVEFEMPEGAVSATAKLRQQSGESIVMGNNNVGGLPECNPMGATQTPCTMNYQAGVQLSSPKQIDLVTTVTIPPASAGYSAALRHQIPNRHTPRTMAPMLQHVNLEDSTFSFQYWDHDGNMLRPYPLGSTDAIFSSPDIVCNRNQEAMTTRGCSVNKIINAQDSALTRYEGNRLKFVVGEPNPKASFKNLKFFYTILMTVSDGDNSISSIFNVNLCVPEYCANGRGNCAVGTAIPSRAPEFVTISDTKEVTREVMDVTIECHYTDQCSYTLYAAHFAQAAGTTLSGLAVTIEPATPLAFVERQGPVANSTQVSRPLAVLGPSRVRHAVEGAAGVAERNVSFGRASTGFARHEREDIGMLHAVCFKAAVEGVECWSVTVCVKVKVTGSPPEFVAPTPPLDIGEPLGIGVKTPVAVCFGSRVRFTVKATDPDETDLVILKTYDNGTQDDGVDLFGDPYNAAKIGSFEGASEVAELGVEYLLSDAQGVTRNPITRFKSFPAARVICSQARDSTFAQYKRWGGTRLPDYYSATKCHEVGFLGPPMFVTDSKRLDSTPFAAIEGSVDMRARLVHAFVGNERVITFRAQDPNKEDWVEILFMADPGLPNGAVPGPTTCTATFETASGVHEPQRTGQCSSVQRSLAWTPMADDANRTIRVCATPRDNSTLCVPPRSPDARATASGWYGEEHCIDLFVVPATLAWTGAFVPAPPPSSDQSPSAGVWRFPDQRGFVGCTLKLELNVMEMSRGMNASGEMSDSPYLAAIEPVARETLSEGSGSEAGGDGRAGRVGGDFSGSSHGALLPVGMSVSGLQGKLGSSNIEYTVPRGEEGSVHEVCFRASEVHGAAALPLACIRIAVQRCMYCAKVGETLDVIMREMIGDSNWLRLWAANGNDDGDSLTPTISHPDQLQAGSMPNPSQPSHGNPFHVGNIYEVQDGDSVVQVASMFHTSVKEILRLNPDIGQNPLKSAVELMPGQEICILPCTRVPSPSNDYSLAY